MLYSDGTGGFQPAVALPAGSLTSDFAIGEFTGDQNPDVLYARRGCFVDGEVPCGDDGLTLLKGDGTGTLTEVLSWDPGGEGPIGVASGGLDNDGRTDAVVTNFNSNEVLASAPRAAPGHQVTSGGSAGVGAGGASVYDKFLKIGGFDPLFTPDVHGGLRPVV